MIKKMIAIVLFLGIFPFCVFPQKKPVKELFLRSRMNSEAGIENLASVGNSRYQILFMEFREPEKKILNIYTPYVALGRIRTTGLLREIKNPAAHNPGSSIFTERTRVAPDRRLRPTGNSGVRLDAGSIVSGFTEESESRFSNLSWQGIYSSRQFGRKASVNLAVTEYDERDDSERSIWYADRKIRYGRKVTNTAFSASYRTGSWGVSCAGALSYYKGANNGLYFRLSPYVRYSFIRFDFLLSGTDDSYIRPDGALSSTALRKGVTALATPVPWIRINTRYVTDVLHKKENDIIYGGYTEEFFGSIIFRPWFLESGVSARNRNIYRDNIFNNYIDTTAFIGLKAGSNKIVFEKRDTYKDYDKISQTYRVEAGARIKHINLYMLWRFKEGIDEKETRVTSRARIRIKNITLLSEYRIVSIERQNRPDRDLTEYTIGIDAKF
ncbi:MAG: hypothetical protein FWD87_08265 [Spirochaetaceae bacterium]|nr:hypothetical protein [Spirochaetaceae bacterium]